MHEPSSRLALLFQRYYAGLATDAETSELMRVIRASAEDAPLAGLMREAWENLPDDEKEFSVEESENMLQSILQKSESEEETEYKEVKIRPLWWLRYAVASMLIIGGIAFYNVTHVPKHPIGLAIESPVQTDIPPGGNRAMLTLADGTQIVLDSVENGLLGSRSGAAFTKKAAGELIVAAASGDKITGQQTNTLSTPKGGQYRITLQDGSKVWLNASSSIRFPTVFSPKNRIVDITGEAFFEVTKDRRRPFKVRFAGSEVEVLGTSFNIMAYDDERASRTTLVEGSVRLRNGSQTKKLKPGEQGAILPDGKIRTATVDTDREIAWKQGLFYFRDAGIEEIMRQAARWYNVDVAFEGNMRKREFTGKVSRNVNISELLNMLRYAGVKCRIEDQKVIVEM